MREEVRKLKSERKKREREGGVKERETEKKDGGRVTWREGERDREKGAAGEGGGGGDRQSDFIGEEAS